MEAHISGGLFGISKKKMALIIYTQLVTVDHKPKNVWMVNGKTFRHTQIKKKHLDSLKTSWIKIGLMEKNQRSWDGFQNQIIIKALVDNSIAWTYQIVAGNTFFNHYSHCLKYFYSNRALKDHLLGAS